MESPPVALCQQPLQFIAQYTSYKETSVAFEKTPIQTPAFYITTEYEEVRPLYPLPTETHIKQVRRRLCHRNDSGSSTP